jgi:hypothetical protein
MKLLLLILGVAVIVLNLFLWYSKKQAGKTKADHSANHKSKLDAPHTGSKEFSNRPDLAQLKESAAAELGISIEELERMPVDEIEELAAEKGLIRLSDKTS